MLSCCHLAWKNSVICSSFCCSMRENIDMHRVFILPEVFPAIAKKRRNLQSIYIIQADQKGPPFFPQRFFQYKLGSCMRVVDPIGLDICEGKKNTFGVT